MEERYFIPYTITKHQSYERKKEVEIVLEIAVFLANRVE